MCTSSAACLHSDRCCLPHNQVLPLPPLPLLLLLLPLSWLAHSRCRSLPALACRPEQVQTKLKLVGIAAVYLASSGEQVTRLDQLQDIDELYVVEVSGRPVFYR